MTVCEKEIRRCPIMRDAFVLSPDSFAFMLSLSLKLRKSPQAAKREHIFTPIGSQLSRFEEPENFKDEVIDLFCVKLLPDIREFFALCSHSGCLNDAVFGFGSPG
jgi:hypothetical protein